MALNPEPWFPSVIWNADLQGIDNASLREFAYQKQQTDLGRTISNRGGYQSNDIQAGESTHIDQLVMSLEQELNELASSVGLRPVSIYNIWVNINPTGSYNHLHNHQESIFSGVYYIDADETQGNINFERNDGAEYHIPSSMITQIHHFNASKCTYPAKTGSLYVFPGWLKHSVDSNNSNRDRISLSFNSGPKNEN